jgi:hypothetical protein
MISKIIKRISLNYNLLMNFLKVLLHYLFQYQAKFINLLISYLFAAPSLRMYLDIYIRINYSTNISVYHLYLLG